MTFDEALEEIASESEEDRKVVEDAVLLAKFLELCDEYGIEVREGTGRFLCNGEEFDIVDEIKKLFRKDNKE